jgi:hypothetical protein
MSKKVSSTIIVIVVVILVIAGALWYKGQPDVTNTTTDSSSESETGQLYVGVTDATTDISGVSEVNAEIKKVEIHNAAKGWVTVSSDSKKYDLMALHAQGKTEFYTNAKVDEGAYDRVRVTLGDVVVKTKDKGDQKAVSPSSQVVMNMAVNVMPGKDTMLKLDFLADKSLHVASNAKFLFTPTVKAQSESAANVTVGTENSIVSTGGNSDSTASVGMDIDGTSRNDFTLKASSDLKVDNATDGTIKFMLGGKTYNRDDSDKEESLDVGATGGANVNTNTNNDNDNGDDNSILKVNGAGALNLGTE